MTTATKTDVVLEPAAQAFADATANPPYPADLGPEKGNKVVDRQEKPTTAFGSVKADVLERTLPGYRRPNFGEALLASRFA